MRSGSWLLARYVPAFAVTIVLCGRGWCLLVVMRVLLGIHLHGISRYPNCKHALDSPLAVAWRSRDTSEA